MLKMPLLDYFWEKNGGSDNCTLSDFQIMIKFVMCWPFKDCFSSVGQRHDIPVLLGFQKA